MSLQSKQAALRAQGFNGERTQKPKGHLAKPIQCKNQTRLKKRTSTINTNGNLYETKEGKTNPLDTIKNKKKTWGSPQTHTHTHKRKYVEDEGEPKRAKCIP